MALISVIIPVYNMEQFLYQCMDSVLTQTLDDIEVVCINDGSNDDSLNILNRYAETDKRVRVYSQENRGVATARNRGIELANGEYLIFMDPDDWYPDQDVLAVLYGKATENHVLICGGEFQDCNELTGEIHVDFPEQYFGYTFEQEGRTYYRDYQYDFGYQRFLFQRAFLLEKGIVFPLLKRFQDPPFMVRAMIEAGEFYAVKKKVYCYRYGHRGNIWTPDKIEDLISGLKQVWDMANDHDLFLLREVVLYRINFEFHDIIYNEWNHGNEKVRNQLESFCEDFQPDKKKLLSYIGERLYQREKELAEQKERQEQYALEKMHEIELLERRAEEVEKELMRIKSSKTFRLGKILLYIPQKVYWHLKR